jgi:signal transduction histidine kinase
MEQVLMNLIGNAVKYSPRGGEIAVGLRASEGSAIIEVRDTGIGIPAEDLEIVGRKAFARGGGRAGTFPGVGVGLYLSRLVAEGHGGALEVESEGDDKGTTVRVRIPVTS